MNTTISYSATFECAYISAEHTKSDNDPLYELNAHRYEISVTIAPTIKYAPGKRIMNFASLKSAVDSTLPDKTWLYTSDQYFDSPIGHTLIDSLKSIGMPANLCAFELTCEGLAFYLPNELQSKVDELSRGRAFVNRIILKENKNVFSTVSRTDED